MDYYEALSSSAPEVASQLRQFFIRCRLRPRHPKKHVDRSTKDAIRIISLHTILMKTYLSQTAEINHYISACFDTSNPSEILFIGYKMSSTKSSRSYHPTKVFPFVLHSQSEAEVMLCGCVHRRTSMTIPTTYTKPPNLTGLDPPPPPNFPSPSSH